MRSRYVVAVVNGWKINPLSNTSFSKMPPPEAFVLDTANCHREVDVFYGHSAVILAKARCQVRNAEELAWERAAA